MKKGLARRADGASGPAGQPMVEVAMKLASVSQLALSLEPLTDVGGGGCKDCRSGRGGGLVVVVVVRGPRPFDLSCKSASSLLFASC